MRPFWRPASTPAGPGRPATRYALLPLAIALAGGGCQAQRPPTPQAVATPAEAQSGLPAVLATVDGSPITLTDLRARAGDDLAQLDLRYRQAQHQIVQTALDSILYERVLAAEAKKQGKSVDELITAQAGGSLDPTDVEVSAWYASNQSRLSGRSLDQLRPQIANMLRQQRRQDAVKKLQDRLYAEHKVAIKLDPFRVPIEISGAPTRGREGAPVTLVEFSDFQCPYCGRFEPTLKQVEQTFRDQVKVVYRQLPLSIHENAFKAAEASLCAQDQGKFWELHDLMFQEQNRLTVADLKEKAGRVGLNKQKFDSCLDSGRHVEQIQNDQKEGRRLGINGTPAIFVNGIPVPGGAVEFETVAQVVRDELARANRR